MFLVTGGAGFIGSNIVASLAARYPGQIYVCDRLRDNDKWRNIAKHEIAEIVHPDRLFEFLDHRAPDLDGIIHMGAISATTERDADKIVQNNFRLSLALWEWCAASDVRFIYASSAATYGDGDQGFNDDQSIDHLSTLLPLNPYGWSKHLFDRRIMRLMDNGGKTPPQWAGLKFFNVYGPNEYHKDGMKSVVAQNAAKIDAGEPISLFRSHRPDFDDGGQSRDFVYVKDCVAVIEWLLGNPKKSGLYNLGTGQARSFLDLGRAIFDACGQQEKVNFIDTPEAIRDRYQYYTEARMNKLRDAGCDHQFHSLEEGVRDYVQNHLLNPDPYL